MKDSYKNAFGGQPASAPQQVVAAATGEPGSVAYLDSLETTVLKRLQSALDGEPGPEDLNKARDLVQIMLDSSNNC